MTRMMLALVVVLTLSPAALDAQDDSRLVAAVRLAQDGQGDSARAIVLGMLNSTSASDTLFPQIVYTMGVVARDASDRSRNFRRVAVEFAGSSWADDALLGLAQEDFAAGRPEASARSIERIREDYPTSALLSHAAYWGARANFELRNNVEACRWLRQGQALAGEDVELLNQLSFYAPRCAESAERPPSSVPSSAPAVATVETTTPVSSTGRFTVQVAAATTEAAAESTAAALRTAGYNPHTVREGGFFKVRVGRYQTRAEAAAAASQIRARSGGGAFVVEEQ